MSGSLFRAVTAAVPTGYEGTGYAIRPGVPAAMPLHAAESLAESLASAGAPAPRVSRMGHYVRPYCGQDLAGKRLLAWRGCGIGDQIVFAGCLGYLARRYPTAEIGLLCDPRIGGGLWGGAENLPFDVLAEPLPLAEWAAYDYHWLCEGTCDGDHEPGQPDIWQGHLASIGHGDAPAEARVPLLPQSAAWTGRAVEWWGRNVSDGRGTRLAPRTPRSMGAPAGQPRRCGAPGRAGAPGADASTHEEVSANAGPVVLWQLAASTALRSLSPTSTLAALGLLAREAPDVRVIATGAGPQYREYADACGLPNVVADTSELGLQEVFCLLGLVEGLVCPDSCLGHAGAVYGTPTVSVWCPFPARARVLGYGNHRPIEARGACSPCWCHERSALDGAPRQGCPLEAAGAAEGRWCRGLQTIRPEVIVKEIVRWATFRSQP